MWSNRGAGSTEPLDSAMSTLLSVLWPMCPEVEIGPWDHSVRPFRAMVIPE